VQAARAFEREYLEKVLARADGNISRGAKAAGVDRKYLCRVAARPAVARRA
jgi:ActR/RegA family two-component response regulator